MTRRDLIVGVPAMSAVVAASPARQEKSVFQAAMVEGWRQREKKVVAVLCVFTTEDEFCTALQRRERNGSVEFRVIESIRGCGEFTILHPDRYRQADLCLEVEHSSNGVLLQLLGDYELHRHASIIPQTTGSWICHFYIKGLTRVDPYVPLRPTSMEYHPL